MPAGHRLLFLSHRAPLGVSRAAGGARSTRVIGGVAPALDRAMAGGTWVAWAVGSADQESMPSVPGLGGSIRTVRLKESATFHAGFANQVLWPLCHIFPNRCSFQRAFWTAYRRANESFAGAVRAALEPGDLVWVNDFHLALVPGLLRAAGAPGRIGLFWHIPFPPPSVFGICPWRADLLGGVLGADLVGFQTDADARAFLDCVQHFLDLPVLEDPRRVLLPGREVRIAVLPVGIDAVRLGEQAADPAVRAKADRLRAALRAETVVLGIDRLDYTKGVEERLLGFERFLEAHPERRRHVSLVQITVPSQFRVPEYGEMKRTIDETVGRILGRFTYEGRPPLAYLYTAFDHDQLAAYYLAADVALVTPLRDGMNLVAKEYVACHTGGDAVLVLSEFAGAARELNDAVLVNPWDPDAIRRQLEAAVAMPSAERRRRMRALGAQVAARDVHWWMSSFLALLSDGGGSV